MYLYIEMGDKKLRAYFSSNIEAMDVFNKLTNALIDGNDGSSFRIGLEVSGNE